MEVNYKNVEKKNTVAYCKVQNFWKMIVHQAAQNPASQTSESHKHLSLGLLMQSLGKHSQKRGNGASPETKQSVSRTQHCLNWLQNPSDFRTQTFSEKGSN